MTLQWLHRYFFRENAKVLRGNAIGISRDRNNISRERNIIARERNSILNLSVSYEHDIGLLAPLCGPSHVKKAYGCVGCCPQCTQVSLSSSKEKGSDPGNLGLPVDHIVRPLVSFGGRIPG